MHEGPRAMGRSASVEPPVRNGLTPRAESTTDLLAGESEQQLHRRFNEVLQEQHNLLNFHKHQFEATIHSQMNVDNLPDHIRVVLSKGLSGVNNYLKLLEAIRLLAGKESMRTQLRITERHMTDCISTIATAEDKLDKVMAQFGLKSTRAPKKAQPATQQKSMSVPPQGRNFEPKDRQSPKPRYDEEKK